MYTIKVLILVMITSGICRPLRKPSRHHKRVTCNTKIPVSKIGISNGKVQVPRDESWETRPGLFEGDIKMDQAMYKKWRVGYRWINFPEKIWKNGVVPYVISNLYNFTSKGIIQSAIDRINYMTCIKFIPWDKKAKDYIYIRPDARPSGCWSYVGRKGNGQQILNLKAPYGNYHGCLQSEGTAMHEMFHALGTFHEQSRWDRNEHVVIHMDNIKPKSKKNFVIQDRNKAFTKYKYDYESLMHYGSYFFASDRTRPTITPKVQGVYMGQRVGMSVLDCFKINDLYGCLNDTKSEKHYRAICEQEGVKFIN